MDEPDEKFQQSRMLHGSLFDDFWRLSQKEVPDGVSDIASLRPFVQTHLSDVRRVHAGHRKELREAEACHPTIFMTQQELSQLTTELYMGKLVLEINSYRAALAKLEAAVATDEDARLATESAHLKSVIAAQGHVAQSDVVVVSPATGGLTVPDGIHWLAAAVQEAARNRHRVSVLAGRQAVAVFNVLSLPTHGMLSPKVLGQVRTSLLMQEDDVLQKCWTRAVARVGVGTVGCSDNFHRSQP